MQDILKTLRVLDPKADHIVTLSKSYTSDAMHFLKKGNEHDALEAYAIAWAYLDALLHLGMIEVSDLSQFTLEKAE